MYLVVTFLGDRVLLVQFLLSDVYTKSPAVNVVDH